MRKRLFIAALVAGIAMARMASADSPYDYRTYVLPDIEVSDLSTMSFPHSEPTDQLAPHKGWWAVSLKNTTGKAWASVGISSGQTDLVAIVQSVTPTDVFVDEFGYSNTSVTGFPAGVASYAGSLGTRTYDNGSNGLLWKSATFTFNTPVNSGSSAKFYVYTDNSYYTGPFADSFSLTLTPTAVPEPGSILALSVGLVGIAGFARRRKS